MKIVINNYELEQYVNILNSPECYRNDISFKIPFSLDWAIRNNAKIFNERFTVYMEMRSDLEKRFIEENKVDLEKNVVKPEYLNEFNECLTVIYSQENEFEIIPIKKADFENRDDFSSLEYTLFLAMVDPNEGKSD